MQRLVLLACLFLGAAGSAVAEPGHIERTIKGASGAVAPGATLPAAGPVTRSERSDAQGGFKIGGRPADAYTVMAVHPGFAESRHDGVRVEAGAAPRLEIALSLALHERVVVAANRSIESKVSVSPKNRFNPGLTVDHPRYVGSV